MANAKPTRGRIGNPSPNKRAVITVGTGPKKVRVSSCARPADVQDASAAGSGCNH